MEVSYREYGFHRNDKKHGAGIGRSIGEALKQNSTR
jgi:hypothetical protein